MYQRTQVQLYFLIIIMFSIAMCNFWYTKEQLNLKQEKLFKTEINSFVYINRKQKTNMCKA